MLFLGGGFLVFGQAALRDRLSIDQLLICAAIDHYQRVRMGGDLGFALDVLRDEVVLALVLEGDVDLLGAEAADVGA